MERELLLFISIVFTFIAGCMIIKLPVSLSMVAAAVVGGFVAGEGLPIRHLVEGTFAYLDTILVISTAIIFMKVIEESGVLDALACIILERFHKKPMLLLCLIMLVVMFPGMITGSSTAAILSAGSIMAPVLMLMGVPKVSTAAILAIGGILGMIAPPVNTPLLIICAGIDIPYSGFTLPLILLTFPLAAFTAIYYGYKHVKEMDYSKIREKMNFKVYEEYGIKIFTPVIVLLILMITDAFIPQMSLGMPLTFLLSAIIGIFTGKKFSIKNCFVNAMNNSLPVAGILMGVGMLIQIMTLTGVRGFIVTSCISLPPSLLYLAMAISIPLFGAVSSYGAASVLGVPFLLAFLSHNQILTAAAISLISALGDMMPPTALSGIFAAKITGVENYRSVLKASIVPSALILILGVLFVASANYIAPFIIF